MIGRYFIEKVQFLTVIFTVNRQKHKSISLSYDINVHVYSKVKIHLTLYRFSQILKLYGF